MSEQQLERINDDILKENICTLKKVIHELKFHEDVVVGGVARYLSCDSKQPHDLDVAVNETVANDYWKFVKKTH